MRLRTLVPTIYIIFLMLPIYWLLNMSFKTTNEILGGFSLWPNDFTFENYEKIFTDPTWYSGYFNSLKYVIINTILSVSVALPTGAAPTMRLHSRSGNVQASCPEGERGRLDVETVSGSITIACQ